MRIEHRVAGADANVYLTVAAILAAALHGIENKLLPPAPSQVMLENGVPGNSATVAAFLGRCAARNLSSLSLLGIIWARSLRLSMPRVSIRKKQSLIAA